MLEKSVMVRRRRYGWENHIFFFFVQMEKSRLRCYLLVEDETHFWIIKSTTCFPILKNGSNIVHSIHFICRLYRSISFESINKVNLFRLSTIQTEFMNVHQSKLIWNHLHLYNASGKFK